jgi:hypothetical protein
MHACEHFFGTPVTRAMRPCGLGRGLLGLGLGLLLGCAETRQDGDGASRGVASSPGSDGESGIDDTEGGSAGVPEDDGTVKLDVAPPGHDTSNPEGGMESCEKVDFLFVVDSSGSMADKQAALLRSFPGFIEAIEATLATADFHVMVVDTGPPLVAGCEGTIGAGTVADGRGAPCGSSGDRRFATGTQDNLVDVFTCMAHRGIEGSGDERVMDALVHAVGPLAVTGQCNDGFLRDDAILVITLITDEEDSPDDYTGDTLLDGTCAGVDDDSNSAGDPDDWFAAVVQAKNGDANAVVVLSLIGDCDADGLCPGMTLHPFNPTAPFSGAEPAPRLREFTGKFTHGTTGPVCADDYSPFFQGAISVIAQACDEFVPPG